MHYVNVPQEQHDYTHCKTVAVWRKPSGIQWMPLKDKPQHDLVPDTDIIALPGSNHPESLQYMTGTLA